MKLKLKSCLYFTQLLVVLSVAGSVISYFTVKSGLGEIYPFYYWKLYTQPLGSNHTFGEYRIYYKNKGDQAWSRCSVAPTHTFSLDEYMYTFGHLTGNVLNAAPSDTLAPYKLLTFIRHVAPAADTYKVVREDYVPRKILKDPAAYDTTTIIRF